MRTLHKQRIFTEFAINLPYTSSRAAKRRGEPESLDCFVATAPRKDGYAKPSIYSVPIITFQFQIITKTRFPLGSPAIGRKYSMTA